MRRVGRRALAVALVLVLAVSGLGAVRLGDSGNPDYNPARSHHTPEGFRNPDGSVIDKPLSDLLRWRWSQAREGLPKPPGPDFQARIAPGPQAMAELSRAFSGKSAFVPGLTLASSPSTAGLDHGASLTWIGHASMALLQAGVAMLPPRPIERVKTPVVSVP